MSDKRLTTFRGDKYGFAIILRNILVEHLDGARVSFAKAHQHSVRRRAIRILLARRLLLADNPVWPESTVLTDKGREELAFLLADYAEALTRAGYGDPSEDKTTVTVGLQGVKELSLGWIAAQREDAEDRVAAELNHIRDVANGRV